MLSWGCRERTSGVRGSQVAQAASGFIISIINPQPSKSLLVRLGPRIVALATLALVAWVTPRAFAAAGELDTTFQTKGYVTTDVRGDDFAYGMAVQSDGKVIIVGSASSADYSNVDFAVVRYNADGTLDSTFGTGGKVTTGIGTGNDIAYGVAVQSDGKIVVAGETNDASSTNANFAVVRYNANGTLDTTFGTGGKVTTGVGSLDDFATCNAIQSDGKILVAGYAYTAADTTNFAVVRYNANGSLDTTFNTTGKVSTDLGGVDVAQAMVVLSTGKIVVGGFTSNTTADYANSALVRYNANGSLDTTFSTTGKVITNMGPTYNYIESIAVQSDGKLVTAGSMVDAGLGVARYTTTGALDSTFGTNGKTITAITGTGSTDAAHSVAIQSDGSIVVAGSTQLTEHDDVALVRFTSSGVLDAGFGSGGKSITNISADAGSDYAYGIKVLSDGSLLVAGETSTEANGYDLFIARFQPQGVAVVLPTAATDPAMDVTGTTATLNGTVNAKALATTITFEYGLTASYGSTISASPDSLSTSADTTVTAALSGLAEATTYHYRIHATCTNGTVLGGDRTFTTSAPPPPVITQHPQGVVAEAGASFTLQVAASGSGLTYQWQRNDQDISGETTSTLSISSFQSTQAGIYTCIVSNAGGGSAPSDPAAVVFTSTLSTALDQTNLKGLTMDPSMWSVVSTGARDGVDALKSGSPSAGGSSKVSVSITGPVRLGFYSKLTATSGAAFLRVLVDGVQQLELTGTQDWTASSLLIADGSHRVEFSFDQTGSGGASECAWLDQLTLTSPSWIDTPPTSRIALLGEAVTFDATFGGLPTTCQWRKNSAAITGQTNPQLMLSNVATTDAALYSVAIGTGAVSPAASLCVVKPATAVRAPAGKTGVFAQTITNGTGATFQWSRGSTPLIDGTKYAGARTVSLSVKTLTALDAGSDYFCTITLGKLTRTIGPFELSIQTVPVVDAVDPQASILSGSYSLQLSASQGPITKWAATSLPSGFAINATTGVITGRPNTANKPGEFFTFYVTATNAAGTSAKLPITISIAPQPAGTSGMWAGLAERKVLVNGDLGGALTLSVTGTGSFTGTLRNGKDSHSLSSRIITDLATGQSAGTQTIARTGRTPLVLSFTLDPVNASLTGTVTTNGETASLTGARNTWATLTPAPAALYNCAMAIPSSLIGDSTAPQGASWTQLTLTTLGSVTISGRMADGAAFTGSSVLGADRRVPVLQVLYSSHGSLHGWQVIAQDQTVSSDSLTWVKTGPASTTDKIYAAGYRIALTTDGAPYVKPTTAAPIVLGLPDAADNALVQFSDANVESTTRFGDLAQMFRISKTNIATFRTTTTGNPCAVKLTLTSSTGAFSGSFTLTDPGVLKPTVRTVSYYGLLLSHRTRGVGCFNLPSLITTEPTLSGSVLLLPVGP